MAAKSPTKLVKSKKVREDINLSSMLDLMTIILLFLLKSFSTSSGMVSDVEGLNLALSSTDQAPIKALTLAIDMDAVWLDTDGKRTEQFESISEMMAESDDPASMLLPGLYTFLSGKAGEAKKMEEQFGVKFNGEITLLADSTVPYNAVLKVMATCFKAGYGLTEFVVAKKD